MTSVEKGVEECKNILVTMCKVDNEENLSVIKSFTFILAKYIRTLGKLFYLKTCKIENKIPKHILKPLTDLESLFNSNFIKKSKRENLFNKYAQDLLNLDISQAHWLKENITNCLNEGKQKMFDTFPSMTDRINRYLKEKIKELSDKQFTELRLKIGKEVRINIRRPYEKINNKNKNKTFISSSNIRNRFKIKGKETDWEMLAKYGELYKKEYVVNLTDKEIPIDVINFLSLGDNVNLFPECIHDDMIKLIADVENIIGDMNTPDNHRNGLRNNIVKKMGNFIEKHKKMENCGKLINKWNKDMKNVIKFKRKNPSLIIIKADKIKKVAIMRKEEYQEKIKELIDNNDSYRKCRIDPIEDVNKRINLYLNKIQRLGFIEEKEKKNLIQKHAVHPRLFGLVKLHKPGRKFRPIVNSIGGPLYKFAKFMKPSLDFVRSNNQYDVKNSDEVKIKLANLKLEESDIMVSYDVASLFTNIPLKIVYEIIDEEWKNIEQYTKIKSKDIFIEGIKIICENGFFKFGGENYRQLFGISMGSVLSVNIAGIVMNKLLKTAIEKANCKIKLIVKYIDDILCIIDKGDMERFFKYLNNFHDRLKFTVEEEKLGKIRFLDMEICRNEEGQITTKWTKKPETSNIILNYFSNHPNKQKINVADNFIHRAIKITDNIYKNEIKNAIFNILEDNFYPKTIIKKLWHKNIDKVKNKNEPNAQNKEYTNKKFYKCTYIKGLSEGIKKSFKDYDMEEVSFGYKPTNKVKQIYHNMKDKIPIGKQTNVVYRVECLDCPGIYIGETGQWVKDRMYQHQNDIKNKLKNPQKTALVQHVTENNHRFNTEDPRILHKETDTKRRRVIEALYIAESSNTAVNFKSDSGNVNTYYADIINRIK